MKMRLFRISLVLLGFTGVFVSCENRQPEKVTKPTPQVFTPQAEPDGVSIQPDSVDTDTIIKSETEVKEVPMRKAIPMPSAAELKVVTPSQEAKRDLSNDAMQVYRLQPEAFFKYLQSRIPYYRGKGNLKAENDLVRLEITKTEMIVETPKGRRTFPMQ